MATSMFIQKLNELLRLKQLEVTEALKDVKVLEKLKAYKHSWHSKKFAPPIILDKLELSKLLVEQSIEYILKLNPRPAGEYISDSTFADYNKPNIVLNIEKISGSVSEDDFSSGIIRGNNNYYFQVKYSNHDLPELRISPDFSFDKNSIKKAQEFINILSFRQNSIILQGCAIVKNQIDFFLNGPGNLKPLTRKKIASQINVHESTISRITGKKSNKYFQTPWGLFSASYFFTSGINSSVKNQKLSAETVKLKIIQILQDYEQKNHKDSNKKNKQLSDSNLTKILNDQGIDISRRTVNKYRSQIGITNSYLRT